MIYDLYKKDISHNVMTWTILLDKDVHDIYEHIVIMTGLFSGKKSHHVIPVTFAKAEQEIESRVKEKKRDGWLSAEDLKIHTITEEVLKQKLPFDHKDLDQRYKPQKAIPFKHGFFIKARDLQPKLNGVRCTILWELITVGVGMFKESYEGVVIASKKGLRYHLPHITNRFKKEDFFRVIEGEPVNIIYDGELYIHGKSLTYIKDCRPFINEEGKVSNCKGTPTELEFWAFDLAIPKVIQEDRTALLNILLKDKSSPIKIDPTVTVYTEEHAISLANTWLDEGYEGAICRDQEALYAFGKRASHMMKIKRWERTDCRVIDVIKKNETTINNKTRTYIAFILENDLNEESFECTPEGDETKRLSYLSERDSLIGTYVSVKYRERSGNKNVPFQAIVELYK